MTDDEINDELAKTKGDALFTSAAIANLWTFLVQRGIIAKDQSLELADLMLLQFEKRQGGATGRDKAALRYAQLRAQSHRARLKKMPPEPGSA